MAEIFDKIITGFNRGVKSIKTTSDTALEKAELRRQISTLEKEKRDMLLNSGSIAYNIYKSGELLDERLESVFAELDNCCGQINSLSLKIEELTRAENTLAVPPQKLDTQDEKKCPNCGTANAVEAKFCANCGSDLSAVKIEEDKINITQPDNICPSCGSQNKDNAKFCCRCGSKLS